MWSRRLSASSSRLRALLTLVVFGAFAADLCWCADLVAPPPTEVVVASCHGPASEQVGFSGSHSTSDNGSWTDRCCCDDGRVVAVAVPETRTTAVPDVALATTAAVTLATREHRIDASPVEAAAPPPAAPPPFLLPLRI